jgi:outer membrane protein assembly factor BamC
MMDTSDQHLCRQRRIGRTRLRAPGPGLAAVLAAMGVLAGCSVFGSNPAGDKGEYRTEAVHDAPLEVPPDLSPLSKDDRFSVSDKASTANALRSATGGAAAASTVALRSAKARVVRDGAQRWLAVDLPPEKAYEVVKEFLPSVGLKIEVDEPSLGIVETAWQEKHAKAPEGLIQRTLNLFIESLVSTGEQDKYRARVERTPNDTSEIFISHRGLEEVYTNSDKTTATWQPRPRDPELEAELLQRLLVRFETGATPELAKGKDKDKAAAAKESATTLAAVSRIVQDGAQSRLDVDEPFDRAWRRVGLALDRGGFTVEDRDRTKGVYFVRYVDPDYEKKVKEGRGLIARIFESDPKIEAQQFRVALLTEGDRTSVRVQDKDGHPQAGSAGDRILKQLDEQMR